MMGMHNRSENGHGARVALHSHPNYARTHSLKPTLIIPRQLFKWAQTNTQNMNSECLTELEFIEEEMLLFKRNSAAKPIHGTLKLHAYLPMQKGKLIVKKFPPQQSVKNVT
jgi:hypothetical protein